MSAGGEPITKCPVCRYDLTGLPKNHRCPECGFEYDETMRVWRPPANRIRKIMSSVFLAVLVIFLWLFAMAIFVFGTSSSSGQSHLLTFIQTIGIAAVVFWEYRVSRSPSFTIVSREGLVYKCPLRASQFVPWKEIDLRQGLSRPLRIIDGKFQRIPLPGVKPVARGALYQAMEIAELAARYPRVEQPVPAATGTARPTTVPLTWWTRIRLLLDDLIENWLRPSQS